MNKAVSVEEAISRGHRMVTYPGLVVLLGTLGLTLFLGIADLFPIWGYPLGFIAAFLFSWLWWSFVITKWRIWAFENVRNVHELKSRAIQDKLIWPDNSFFEKTEIRTSSQKEKLITIQYKFNQDDFFEDELTIPNETLIYFSKHKKVLNILVLLFGLGLGIFLLVFSDRFIIGSMLSFLGAYFTFKEFKETSSSEPQIILNSEGVFTISTNFISWKEIENEEVIRAADGTNCFLSFKHPNGIELLEIDNLNIDFKKLNNLLKVYRCRNSRI